MTSEPYSGPLKPPDKPDKKIERVTSSDAIVKPKSLGRKFKDVFFGGDAKHATRYVVAEVLLPGIRNLIFDGVTKSAERMLFGDSPVRRPLDYRPRTQYHSPFQPQRPFMPDPRGRGRLPDQNPYRVNRMDAGDIVLATREDCEAVVEQMINLCDNYDSVSLADLYELIGQPSSPIDNKWGWQNLGRVQIRQVRNGFAIDLPPMEAL